MERTSVSMTMRINLAPLIKLIIRLNFLAVHARREPELDIYVSLLEGRQHVKRFLPHTDIFQRTGRRQCPQPPDGSDERLPGAGPLPTRL